MSEGERDGGVEMMTEIGITVARRTDGSETVEMHGNGWFRGQGPSCPYTVAAERALEAEDEGVCVRWGSKSERMEVTFAGDPRK
jgi:hypothetical protein